MSPRIRAISELLDWQWLVPVGLAVTLGSLLALAGSSPTVVLVVMGATGYLLFAAMSIREPLVFVAVFLLLLEVFPPIYLSKLGERPLYPALFLLPVGVLIVVFRLRDFHFKWDPVAKGLAVFLGGTACSLPFAYWLSGVQTGMESLSRWILLSLTALVYFLIRGGARVQETRIERSIYPLLLVGAVLSAGYGIVDFIWPVPLPHPAPSQLIWIGSTVLHRAQGVFYESANFANFCGFFLVVASATFLKRRERYLGVPRWLLLLFVAAFGLAVLVAFSRSAWIAITVALLVFSFHSGLVKTPRAALLLFALGVPLFLLWTFSPELWEYFLEARLGHLTGILANPNVATSGRFETWIHVLDIVQQNPQYLVLGVGYKTLTFTRLFHGEIITDNGYLSLLLETGAVGLACFLFFSGTILKIFSKLARQGSEAVAFWSALMLSLWLGELVQFLAADAYTYWRNMVILIALMAFTLNRAERLQRSPKQRGGERFGAGAAGTSP